MGRARGKKAMPAAEGWYVELPTSRGANCAVCGERISLATYQLRVVHYSHFKLLSGQYTARASSTRSFCLLKHGAVGVRECITGVKPTESRLLTDRLAGGVASLEASVQSALRSLL